MAAKFLIPHKHEDAIIKRVPSQQELLELRERFPGTLIKLDIEPGLRLSDLPNRDSSSYHIGTIYLAADSYEELRERYRNCLDALHFEFDSVSQ